MVRSAIMALRPTLSGVCPTFMLLRPTLSGFCPTFKLS
ncbi:hypothetical protein J2R98_002569 [Alkalibacillus filiformis]|uniref:Uncharacterized protein n=1 Tax=Alkalibacillus filiformis TaxID=200990 RepID=A0ABU0DW76_9BACI|nr:hypothetical protein [Alkalibacillus filiformis]